MRQYSKRYGSLNFDHILEDNLAINKNFRGFYTAKKTDNKLGCLDVPKNIFLESDDNDSVSNTKLAICQRNSEPFDDQNIFDDFWDYEYKNSPCKMIMNGDNYEINSDFDQLKTLFIRQESITEKIKCRKRLLKKLSNGEYGKGCNDNTSLFKNQLNRSSLPVIQNVREHLVPIYLEKSCSSTTVGDSRSEDVDEEKSFQFIEDFLLQNNKKMIEFMVSSGSKCKRSRLDDFPNLKMNSWKIADQQVNLDKKKNESFFYNNVQGTGKTILP
ncbi:uncharacterized protein LOC108733827 isoform X3 [Agrilus planipennis]|uniref:Uncharacterized protein LOC108733827 isoform X3 n=1 Tax=Agrilus planipennis TaxID=224129 RepID=A0A7F5RHZ1_AGRPL|nr:uncharacterized protein LOC108733827 isoform X3 [Agrilus planipennis]